MSNKSREIKGVGRSEERIQSRQTVLEGVHRHVLISATPLSALPLTHCTLSFNGGGGAGNTSTPEKTCHFWKVRGQCLDYEMRLLLPEDKWSQESPGASRTNRRAWSGDFFT